MILNPADDREPGEELYQPKYRLYLYEREDKESSWSVECWDVREADFIDVILWLNSTLAPNQAWALATIHDGDKEAGNPPALHWLVGGDPNRAQIPKVNNLSAEEVAALGGVLMRSTAKDWSR